jgi:hypothetical protein
MLTSPLERARSALVFTIMEASEQLADNHSLTSSSLQCYKLSSNLPLMNILSVCALAQSWVVNGGCTRAKTSAECIYSRRYPPLDDLGKPSQRPTGLGCRPGLR